jgi:hypothetical protein
MPGSKRQRQHASPSPPPRSDPPSTRSRRPSAADSQTRRLAALGVQPGFRLSREACLSTTIGQACRGHRLLKEVQMSFDRLRTPSAVEGQGGNTHPVGRVSEAGYPAELGPGVSGSARPEPVEGRSEYRGGRPTHPPGWASIRMGTRREAYSARTAQRRSHRPDGYPARGHPPQMGLFHGLGENGFFSILLQATMRTL